MTIQKDQAEEPWSATTVLYTIVESFEAPPESLSYKYHMQYYTSTTFDGFPLLTDVCVHD